MKRRDEFLAWLRDRVLTLERPHPTRVAIDGFSTSGKTSLADELAPLLEARRRQVIRASLDNFKRPWSERHRYDRASGEGYYRNAYDCDLIRSALLEPLGPGGSRRYRSSSIDPASQQPATGATGFATDNAVLLADGVFAFRPELNDLWDLRIFLDLDPETVLQRGADRDQTWAGSWEAASELYRSRYIPSEQIYVAEVNPHMVADIVIDQRDFENPQILSARQRRRATPKAATGRDLERRRRRR